MDVGPEAGAGGRDSGEVSDMSTFSLFNFHYHIIKDKKIKKENYV